MKNLKRRNDWVASQKDYWDKEANNYDQLYLDPWSQEEDNFIRELIFKKLNLAKDSKVVDLGSGSGLGYTLLSKTFSGFSYTGVDISKNMIRFSERKYPEQNFINCSFDSKDCWNFKEIDLIIGLNGTLSYSEDICRLLDEAHNSLTEDGTVFLTYYNRNSLSRLVKFKFSKCDNPSTRHSSFNKGSYISYFSKKEIMDTFSDYGFDETDVVGMSMFGRLLELPILWKLDKYLCKLFPRMAYLHIISANKKPNILRGSNT